MRFNTCLPESWWEFAIEHATHVYNRTPVRRLNWSTPFQMLYNDIPRVDHLRVFGCGAYVHIPADVQKNKMAPKSELMVYIGVADGMTTNFKFMRSPNNFIFTSAYALFNENIITRGLNPQCQMSMLKLKTAKSKNPFSGIR
jgi:hypothetical protein